MKTTTHYPDFEVVELTNEDAAEVLSAGLELVPTEEERVRAVLAPRPVHVVTMTEQHEMAMKAASDYAWSCVKREQERAMDEQLRWGAP